MYQSILTQNDGEENSLQPVCYKLDLDLIRFRSLFCWHTQMCKAILANRSPELYWEYSPLLLSLCFHVWLPAFAKPLSPLVLLWTCDNPWWEMFVLLKCEFRPPRARTLFHITVSICRQVTQTCSFRCFSLLQTRLHRLFDCFFGSKRAL